jgi:electron transport complex protein RnfB
MTLVTIGLAAGTMFVMAIIMSYILGWANKTFHVDVDPKVEAVIDALPGANCGGCGFVGCSEYAVAVVLENMPVNMCPVGGENCSAAIADIMGVEVGEAVSLRPVVYCRAGYSDRLGRTDYRGEQKCAAANLVAGVQGCTYGCLGFGECTEECDYDAIHIIDGLATIDYDKCIGCGACVKICPRNVISIEPFREDKIIASPCSNKDKAKDVKSVCNVGCIGCSACTRASDIITMKDNLPVVDYDKYSEEPMENIIKAMEKCKPKCLEFIGKQP